LDIDNTFITAAYTDLQKNTDTSLTNDAPTSTRSLCALVGPDKGTATEITAKETAMKEKIPADYGCLKKSIIDNINGDVVLNP